MSKELTEQWREGTLPEDCYYILTKNGHVRKDRTRFCSHTDEQCFCFTLNREIEEVLAPVPDYDECEELIRKSDKLDKIMSDTVTNQGDCQQIVIDNLNRQIESLQEQLTEANDVIKFYANSTCGDKRIDGSYVVCTKETINGCIEIIYDPNIASNYLKKWDIPNVLVEAELDKK